MEGETAFEQSVLEFSLPLYKALPKDGNAFMSPYSVSAALMLVLLGTDGETKSELETALKLSGLSGTNVHLGYKILHQKLISKTGKGSVVAIANRIFLKLGLSLKEEFNQNALKYYGSEVEQLDFERNATESRMIINAWIEKQTNDKIKDLIPPNFLSKDTMMVLTNAIYFKGDWDLKFQERHTSKRPFYLTENDAIDVDMMSNKKEVMSGDSKELDCKCLELQYKGGKLSMVILLPNKRTGLQTLEDTIESSLLHFAISNLHRQETVIWLPKFKIETTFNLTSILPELGIKKIFQKDADFSGMFKDGKENLYVSDVIHKAYVDVNEEGTEAAAATAVQITLMCMPVKPFEFKADHPFLFLIRDNDSGTILFMGRYAKPE